MRAAMQRRIKRERRIELTRKEDQDEKAMHVDGILRAYEEAYEAYNGRAIVLCYMRGFVRLDGAHTPRHDGQQVMMKPYRLKEIENMTRELQARVHANSIGGNDE